MQAPFSNLSREPMGRWKDNKPSLANECRIKFHLISVFNWKKRGIIPPQQYYCQVDSDIHWRQNTLNDIGWFLAKKRGTQKENCVQKTLPAAATRSEEGTDRTSSVEEMDWIIWLVIYGSDQRFINPYKLKTYKARSVIYRRNVIWNTP